MHLAHRLVGSSGARLEGDDDRAYLSRLGQLGRIAALNGMSEDAASAA